MKILVFFLGFLVGVQAQPIRESTSLFKQYGGLYASSLEDTKVHYAPIALAMNLREGENVASIGAKAMTLEIGLSMVSDSVHFTLENIDTLGLNWPHLKRVKHYYETVCNKKLSSSFDFKIGTERNTTLTSNAYDKVLVASSLHEFTHVQEMMTDLNRIMKRDGHLFVIELEPLREGQLHGGCNMPMLDERAVRKMVEPAGFNLKKVVTLQESTSDLHGKKLYHFVIKPN